MNAAPLLLATRNEHKAREVREILGPADGIRILTPMDLELAPTGEEEQVERFHTFLGNAVAKAGFFARRSGMPALADDSGLAVDALDGAPGVRSKRFAADAGRTDPENSDLANNRLLLERLADVPEESRTARFVCTVALLPSPDAGPFHFIGTCSGRIAHELAGDAGFGYDPLFFLPALNRTMAQISPQEKNRISHRGRAFRAVASRLPDILHTLDRTAVSP